MGSREKKGVREMVVHFPVGGLGTSSVKIYTWQMNQISDFPSKISDLSFICAKVSAGFPGVKEEIISAVSMHSVCTETC